MEANKDFSTLFLIFDKIKQNVNNNKNPQYYGVTVILNAPEMGIKIMNCEMFESYDLLNRTKMQH